MRYKEIVASKKRREINATLRRGVPDGKAWLRKQKISVAKCVKCGVLAYFKKSMVPGGRKVKPRHAIGAKPKRGVGKKARGTGKDLKKPRQRMQDKPSASAAKRAVRGKIGGANKHMMKPRHRRHEGPSAKRTVIKKSAGENVKKPRQRKREVPEVNLKKRAVAAKRVGTDKQMMKPRQRRHEEPAAGAAKRAIVIKKSAGRNVKKPRQRKGRKVYANQHKVVKGESAKNIKKIKKNAKRGGIVMKYGDHKKIKNTGITQKSLKKLLLEAEKLILEDRKQMCVMSGLPKAKLVQIVPTTGEENSKKLKKAKRNMKKLKNGGTKVKKPEQREAKVGPKGKRRVNRKPATNRMARVNRKPPPKRVPRNKFKLPPKRKLLKNCKPGQNHKLLQKRKPFEPKKGQKQKRGKQNKKVLKAIKGGPNKVNGRKKVAAKKMQRQSKCLKMKKEKVALQRVGKGPKRYNRKRKLNDSPGVAKPAKRAKMQAAKRTRGRPMANKQRKCKSKIDKAKKKKIYKQMTKKVMKLKEKAMKGGKKRKNMRKTWPLYGEAKKFKARRGKSKAVKKAKDKAKYTKLIGRNYGQRKGYSNIRKKNNVKARQRQARNMRRICLLQAMDSAINTLQANESQQCRNESLAAPDLCSITHLEAQVIVLPSQGAEAVQNVSMQVLPFLHEDTLPPIPCLESEVIQLEKDNSFQPQDVPLMDLYADIPNEDEIEQFYKELLSYENIREQESENSLEITSPEQVNQSDSPEQLQDSILMPEPEPAPTQTDPNLIVNAMASCQINTETADLLPFSSSLLKNSEKINTMMDAFFRRNEIHVANERELSNAQMGDHVDLQNNTSDDAVKYFNNNSGSVVSSPQQPYNSSDLPGTTSDSAYSIDADAVATSIISDPARSLLCCQPQNSEEVISPTPSTVSVASQAAPVRVVSLPISVSVRHTGSNATINFNVDVHTEQIEENRED